MKRHYEVAVVGGGISGCALFYQLARYTDVKSLALFEKYEDLATLNSRGECNSQTIHCGDIETNYDFEKAKKGKRRGAHGRKIRADARLRGRVYVLAPKDGSRRRRGGERGFAREI